MSINNGYPDETYNASQSMQSGEKSSAYNKEDAVAYQDNTRDNAQTPPMQRNAYGQPQRQPIQGRPFNSSISAKALEYSPAIQLLGKPGTIRSIPNTNTGITERYQTQLIEVDIQRNKWGFGINLGESNGIVRIQGCRTNPDGTLSPVQKSKLIIPNDVILMIEGVLLTREDPLGKAVSLMQNVESVHMTLLRQVKINTPPKTSGNPPIVLPSNEIQVLADLTAHQLHQLQYQIMVLKYLQYRRIPDQSVLSAALGGMAWDYTGNMKPKPVVRVTKKRGRKHVRDETDSDEDDDYHIYLQPSDMSGDSIRRSLRNQNKKTFVYNDDHMDLEDELYEKEQKQVNEERKDENEVLSKIEMIIAARFRQKKKDEEEEVELLIKWKNHSYRHMDWIDRKVFIALGPGALFRCRNFLHKQSSAIEHFAYDDAIPPDSEYYDPEVASIDRVLWIKDVKNKEESITEATSSTSVYNKVKSVLESPLLTYYLTPYMIYRLVSYKKGMDAIIKRREEIMKELGDGSDVASIKKEEPEKPECSSNTALSELKKEEPGVSEEVVVTAPLQEKNNEDKSALQNELEQLQQNEDEYAKNLFELPTLPATIRLILIKWNNQTYDEVTWELEDDVKYDQSKIITFHRYNRLPDLKNLVSAFSDQRPVPDSYKQYKSSMPLKNNVILREYQIEGVNWLIFSWYQRRNCILADEMGLGKTIQSIALLNHFYTEERIRGPFLVLAPLSTLGHWKREIENATDLNVVCYHAPHGGEESRSKIRQYEFKYANEEYTQQGIYKFNVLLTTYSILIADLDVLQSIHWKYMIIDEAQRAKSQTTKLFSSLRQIKADAKLLLTGTPLQNNMNELWSLLNFIEPSTFSSEAEFLIKYGNLTDANQVASLQTVLKPFFLRRVKSDVEKNIPPKVETVVDIELTMLQKKYYRAIYDRNRTFLEYKGASMAQLVNIVTELRKCCNHPYMIRGVIQKETNNDRVLYNKLLVQASGKFMLLSKLLPSLHDENHQVLIFSQFITTLDLLEDLLLLLGYSFDRLDGSVRGDVRQVRIDRFNAGKSFAFLLSTKAGGLGLNLTAADTVIIFDNDWNPQNDVQAEARAHRIGQQKSVHVYRLVTKGTYEQELFSRASRKLGLSQAVFESGGIHNHFHGPALEETSSLFDMDVNRIEQLLKYGAYALTDTDNDGGMEQLDFNEFMKANSHTYVVKDEMNEEHEVNDNEEEKTPDTTDASEVQSTVESKEKEVDPENPVASLKFNQAYFLPRGEKKEINFKDPDFWDKVLGPKKGEKLFKELEPILTSKDSGKIADYLQELSDLVTDVVREKVSGNIHADYERTLDILHTLCMSSLYLGDTDVGEIAGRWKEVLQMKGRQLRRKRLEKRIIKEEGKTIEIVDFADSEPSIYKGNWADSDSEHESKRSKHLRNVKRKDYDADVEKPMKKRVKKSPNKETEKCNLTIRLSIENCEGKTMYNISAIIENTVKSGKKRGRKPKVVNDENAEEPPTKVIKRSKKAHSDVYFDLSNEISKATYASFMEQPKVLRDDSYCCVCYGDYSTQENPFMCCCKCGTVVHKYCYGIDIPPEQAAEWKCDYCDYCEKNALPWKPADLVCPLCFYTGGAYKQTMNGRWVHAVCAVWASEIRFGDEMHMRSISGIETIPESTFKHKCFLCHNSGSYALKCMNPTCSKRFHPICGRKNNLRMEYVTNEGLMAFCDKHNRKKRVSKQLTEE